MCEKFPTTGIGIALDSQSDAHILTPFCQEVFLTISANYQHLTASVNVTLSAKHNHTVFEMYYCCLIFCRKSFL